MQICFLGKVELYIVKNTGDSRALRWTPDLVLFATSAKLLFLGVPNQILDPLVLFNVCVKFGLRNCSVIKSKICRSKPSLMMLFTLTETCVMNINTMCIEHKLSYSRIIPAPRKFQWTFATVLFSVEDGLCTH